MPTASVSDSPQVPDGWNVVRLGEVANVVMGQSPPGVTVVDLHDEDEVVDGLPFIQGNAEFGARFPVPRKRCTRPLKTADQGDLLISVRAPVGHTSRVDTPLAIGRGLAAVRFVGADSSFGWHTVNRAREGLGRVSQGSTFEAIGGTELRALTFRLPPLEEQRAIAAVLDSIDEAIERADEVIAATERLRDALLRELLIHGLPGWHSKLREIPGLGSIPASWKVIRLGEVAEVRSGQVDPREPGLQQLQFVAPDDIEPATGRLILRRRVSDAGAISSKYEFDEQDVIYSKIRPYLMKVYLPKNRGLCSADMYPIRPRRGLTRGYLALVLVSPSFTEYARTCSDRTGIPKINRTDLLQFQLRLPSLSEQRAIVFVLDSVDCAIEQTCDENTALHLLQTSIADALLTGRIRTMAC